MTASEPQLSWSIHLQLRITWIFFSFPGTLSSLHCFLLTYFGVTCFHGNDDFDSGWGADPNCFMIRPNRPHTSVFPDRNYRVWTEAPAHYSLNHDLVLVWSEVNLVWKVWSQAYSSVLESDHKLFERNWVWSEMFSNAIVSGQWPFWAPYFFHFFVFFTDRWWLCQEATIKQRSDQRLI